MLERQPEQVAQQLLGLPRLVDLPAVGAHADQLGPQPLELVGPQVLLVPAEQAAQLPLGFAPAGSRHLESRMGLPS
jgi:hypothetical protein